MIQVRIKYLLKMRYLTLMDMNVMLVFVTLMHCLVEGKEPEQMQD